MYQRIQFHMVQDSTTDNFIVELQSLISSHIPLTQLLQSAFYPWTSSWHAPMCSEPCALLSGTPEANVDTWQQRRI